jgi:hypothetical protein
MMINFLKFIFGGMITFIQILVTIYALFHHLITFREDFTIL